MQRGYKDWAKSQARIEKQRESSEGKLSYHDSSDKIISVKQTNSQTGITFSYDMRLAIVKPSTTYKPLKQDVSIFERLHQLGVVRMALRKLSGVVAVDIETKGTQAADYDNCELMGIGLADANNIYYFDFATNGSEVNQEVLDFLSTYDEGFVGHNVFFDSAFLQRYCGKWINWKYDTYGMYKQLANEGYSSQRWGLKSAQLQLLGWEDKGDVELDEWLVRTNHIADIKKEEKPGYVYVDNVCEKTGEGRWCKPRKSEMWRAPANILGYYCGLDTASTWQLLHDVFLPSIKEQPYEETFLKYHELFIDNVRLMVSQQLSGISIDKELLEKHHNFLLDNIDKHYQEFINHPQVRPIASEYNQKVITSLLEEEPTKYKKRKPLGKEPNKYRKDGGISKTWIAWDKKREAYQTTEPDISKNWIKWNEKVEEAKHKEHLNLNSSAQLQWLFYDKLGYPIKIRTYGGGTTEPLEQRYSFKRKRFEANPEWQEWKDSTPSTGVKALPGFGEIGQLLKKQKDDVKEEGYIKACLEHLINGRIHPQFRMPGTLTCRLAGSGGINLQQIPKSRGYLECWKPLPGKTWIDNDHSALEQVVLAELSKDNSLFKIYGPTAKPNDIYLFNGAQLPGIGEAIRAAGYSSDFPDTEIIKHVKKICKKERSISKTITLGSSYGMGANKLQMTLHLQGIEISNQEAREMLESYWAIYVGVKQYEEYLLSEYKKNNGWVLNGIGRPIGVAKDSIKDIVNRVVQSTGHDIHMMYIQICDRLLQEAGIKVNGLVWDFHDQSIVECDEQDAERVKQIIGYDAYTVLNDEYLQGQIKLKGDPQIIRNFADAKCE